MYERRRHIYTLRGLIWQSQPIPKRIDPRGRPFRSAYPMRSRMTTLDLKVSRETSLFKIVVSRGTMWWTFITPSADSTVQIFGDTDDVRMPPIESEVHLRIVINQLLGRTSSTMHFRPSSKCVRLQSPT